MRPITPRENNGTIRIRFTRQGSKYSLTLMGLHWASPSDRAQANAIAAQMESDWEQQKFDTTLDKYRPEAYMPSAPVSLLDAWDSWVEAKNLPPHTKEGHYKQARLAIIRGDVFRPGLSATTHNMRRSFIRSAVAFAKEQGRNVVNPYSQVQSRRSVKKEVVPFTADELKAISGAAEQLTLEYCYFIRALIVSGCRFGEIAALQGYQIDVKNGSVLIDASYSVDPSTNGYRRKCTKTQLNRTLKSRQLVELLLFRGKVKKHDYVFTGPKGKPIRRNCLTQRQWPKVLKAAGVEYRNIHVLRHTMFSLAIESRQLTIPQAAKVAGHVDSSQMMKTYAHAMEVPEVPVIDITP